MDLSASNFQQYERHFLSKILLSAQKATECIPEAIIWFLQRLSVDRRSELHPLSSYQSFTEESNSRFSGPTKLNKMNVLKKEHGDKE
jgi:hypothetical protein